MLRFDVSSNDDDDDGFEHIIYEYIIGTMYDRYNICPSLFKAL